MNIGTGISLKGEINVEKYSRKRSSSLSFENVVLDVGWQNLIDAHSSTDRWLVVPKFLLLGTGTTEPAVTDTGLEAASGTLPAKAESDMTSIASGHDPYCEITFKYGEGEAEGVWTELGLSYDSAYTKPFNRALFRDSGGNPISLTVLSDEFLNITIKITISFDPLASLSGSIDYNGTLINYTASIVGGGSFWEYGFPDRTYHTLGGERSLNADKTTKPGSLILTMPGYVVDPGTARSMDKMSFSHWAYEIVRVVFDQVISVPSDHKITVQECSLEIYRIT